MITRLLAASTLALLVSAVAAAGPAHAQACKSVSISDSGKWSHTKFGARLSARRAWSTKVSRLYGPRYATWSRAQRRHYTCWEAGRRDRCRAIARPCRARR